MEIERLSVTKLATYERCPYCFWCDMQGHKPLYLSDLSLGSDLHKAIGDYHLGNPIKFGLDETSKFFDLYKEEYPDPTLKGMPMDVEEKFAIRLVRPDYKRDLGIVMSGIPDLITRGTLYEHKTSASPYSQRDIDIHFQATAYAWYYYSAYRHIPNIIFNIFVKHKTPRLEIMTARRRTMHDFVAWFDKVEFIVNEIKKDQFLPSDAFWHTFAECPSYNAPSVSDEGGEIHA